MGIFDFEDMNIVLKLNFPTCFCSFSFMLHTASMHFCQKHDFLLFVSCRSGLKRGVYVYLECANPNCTLYTLDLSTNCSSQKPFVVECLSEDSERIETCHLLHSKPTPSYLTLQLKSDEVQLQIGQQLFKPKGDLVEVRVSATTVVNHPTARY